MVLLELSKKRESFADLAPILWHSTGTVAALLQEIVSIYSLLTPPTLTAHASNRVCNALALLQCVASHADTRQPFLAANMYVRYVFVLVLQLVDTISRKPRTKGAVNGVPTTHAAFCIEYENVIISFADLYIFIRF